MRLPRPRFTVGGLILAVAILTVNCAVLRLLYDKVNTPDPAWELFFCLAVGMIPQFNAALVGLTRCALRRLHERRGRDETLDPPSPPGFTYFSLQFLALTVFTAVIFPDATLWCLSLAATAFGPLTERLSFLDDWDRLGVLTYSAGFLYLCVLVSGPLLLLSWLGGRLARRCAATLPRWRFRALACLVSLGFASVALAVAVTPESFQDQRVIEIEFQVFDRDSGQPIRGAFARLTDAFRSMSEDTVPSGAFTDVHGRATLRGSFETSGDRTAFKDIGVFSPWGYWLDVSAAGYCTLRIPLPDALGPRIELERPGPGKVALDRGQTAESHCRDIAGRYTTAGRGQHGWTEFEILADGRFAHIWSGHHYWHREYGSITPRNDGFELVSIPCPGADTSRLTNLAIRRIQWGDHTYLIRDDDRALDAFCRKALKRSLPDWATSRSYFIYVRGTDPDRLPTGLPRLPAAVWAQFVLDEVTLRHDDGVVRTALDNLIKRFR
jgi:hypothetical protein